MTLKQLPNLALFRFTNPRKGENPERVWQKQFRPGTGVAKGLTIDYIAQAMPKGKGWQRDAGGSGGVGGRRKVVLVAIRKAKLRCYGK